MAKKRVLVIDDEESPRESLRQILKDDHEVVTKTDGASGLEALRQDGPFDLVLLDMKMPGLDGLEVLARILQLTPYLPVVMATAITDVKPAVQAMKMGAADYLNKPFDVDEIRLVVERCLKTKALEREVDRLRTELRTSYTSFNLVGSSPAMQKVYTLIQRLMDTDTTALVLGETGTGKELVARALHFHSQRKDGPFIPVHCAAIPGELIESELFGHEKGSFTGALQRHIGMFEAATGGTLFLDEIGEMPLSTQGKLLRALQEREIRRVGGQETIPINVRLVCATNRDLEHDVKTGAFREDLYYRINVVPIPLPPLRDRRDDISPLILFFGQRLSQQLNRPLPRFSPEAMDRMIRHSWPGNVRELEHTVERLMVTADDGPIGVEQLPFAGAETRDDAAAVVTELAVSSARQALGEPPVAGAPKIEFGSGGIDLTKLTDDLERTAIVEALQRTSGVITEAARALNITRRMLRYKMDRLGIPTIHPASTELEKRPLAP